MKYLLLAILATLTIGCGERANFKGNPIIVRIKKKGTSENCVYILKAQYGSFIDDCGKFNIGDTVTTIKR